MIPEIPYLELVDREAVTTISQNSVMFLTTLRCAGLPAEVDE
jgi:hypothetical protein